MIQKKRRGFFPNRFFACHEMQNAYLYGKDTRMDKKNHFILAVISSPVLIEREHGLITALFENGLELLHLRKPGKTEEECGSIIRNIPEKYRDRIAVHDWFGLAPRYGLKGIHLNMRNSTVPEHMPAWQSISRSCHSIEEAKNEKDKYDYIFLSPVFDSISKQGYMSAYTESELETARIEKIIDSKVIALGGISRNNIAKAMEMGFGGAAVLGEIWSAYDENASYAGNMRSVTSRFNELKSITENI